VGDELARGREAGGRLAWADAYTTLSLADQSATMTGADLELLASAAYLARRCLRGSRAAADDRRRC
jgi:hypothetical protein